MELGWHVQATVDSQPEWSKATPCHRLAAPPPKCRAAAALDAARRSQRHEEQHALGAPLATVCRACQATCRLLTARSPPAGLVATARLAAADSQVRGVKTERDRDKGADGERRNNLIGAIPPASGEAECWPERAMPPPPVRPN
jgi:hypothetical protein